MDNETPPSGIPTPPSGTSLPPDFQPISSGSESARAEQPRMGRARERQLRRQQRLPMVQPAGSRRMIRQTAPSDRFKLPKIKIPGGRNALYVVGAVLFVVAVVYILGRIRNNEPTATPPNALWIGTEWTYATHDDGTMRDYVQKLRDHQVGTVYAWVSWLQSDQTWRGEDNFETVKTFVEQFKQFYPEALLYGWISFPVDIGEGGYRLDNVALQQIVADFSAKVVNEFGFDGVFLNIEPVWNNDQNFLALLRLVRSAVGNDVPISAAIPPDWSPIGVNIPVPPLIVPGTVWDREYKQSVALLVDEMAVMAYNSGLSSPSDYSQWMAYQVRTFAQSVDQLGGGTEIVIGIPTYDAELPGHDPNVESIAAAVEGIRSGLQQAGDAAAFVRGLGVYADWETDDTEWASFKQNWVDS
ncbi:MAG TPA: glycosyl hydrolase family 18 protein [Oceanobacillus sp.]|nr:glycosyl hydrolase family 18 protein [Oceanobacillus sp.]